MTPIEKMLYENQLKQKRKEYLEKQARKSN